MFPVDIFRVSGNFEITDWLQRTLPQPDFGLFV